MGLLLQPDGGGCSLRGCGAAEGQAGGDVRGRAGQEGAEERLMTVSVDGKGQGLEMPNLYPLNVKMVLLGV